jgi:hypothetical protein
MPPDALPSSNRSQDITLYYWCILDSHKHIELSIKSHLEVFVRLATVSIHNKHILYFNLLHIYFQLMKGVREIFLTMHGGGLISLQKA